MPKLFIRCRSPFRFCMSLMLTGPLLVISGHSLGTTQASPPSQRMNAHDDEKRVKSDARESQNAKALMMLKDSIDDSPKIQSSLDRARLLAEAAATLWEHDATQGREVLLRAWKATLQKDSALLPFEQQLVQAEIITRVRQRDPEMLKSLEGLSQRQADFISVDSLGEIGRRFGRPSGNGLKWWEELEKVNKALARGDISTASAITEANLRLGFDQYSLYLLTILRARAPEQADAIYANLVWRESLLPFVFPDAVSHLASYLFNPGQYEENGQPHTWLPEGIVWPAPADVAPQIRRLFIDFAAKVMLDQGPPPGDWSRIAIRLYYNSFYQVIMMLLPRFDEEAPEYSGALRARLAEITSQVSPVYLSGKISFAGSSTLIAQSSGNPTSKTAAGLDDEHRDKAVLLARLQQIEPARDEAAKILDTEKKAAVLKTISLADAEIAIGKNDFDRLMEIVSGGDLSAPDGIRFLAQIAAAFAKKDPVRASSALSDASRLVKNIEGSSSRLQALVQLSQAALLFDRSQAWEFFEAAIKVAETPAGKEEKPARKSASVSLVPLVKLSGRLSKLDWDRAQIEVNSAHSPLAKSWLKLGIAQANFTRPETKKK